MHENLACPQARRILEKVSLKNCALLVDAIHFFRADNRFDELRDVSLRYLQLCDAKAERPADMQEIIRQARGDRMFPGEGGLDLRGLMNALPPDLPINLEIPLAQPMPPNERARRALQAARALLAC